MMSCLGPMKDENFVILGFWPPSPVHSVQTPCHAHRSSAAAFSRITSARRASGRSGCTTMSRPIISMTLTSLPSAARCSAMASRLGTLLPSASAPASFATGAHSTRRGIYSLASVAESCASTTTYPCNRCCRCTAHRRSRSTGSRHLPSSPCQSPCRRSRRLGRGVFAAWTYSLRHSAGELMSRSRRRLLVERHTGDRCVDFWSRTA